MGRVSSKSSVESNSLRLAGSDSVSYASWMALNFSSIADLVSSSAIAAPALSGWCSRADFLYAAVQAGCLRMGGPFCRWTLQLQWLRICHGGLKSPAA